MKIEGVKKTKSGKYKITFDNNETLNTFDDVILNNGLLFNKEVDSSLLDKLNIETSYYEIYNKTIKFIARKLRSEKEVRLFLVKNKVLEEDMEKIVKKLREIKLINDKNYANAYFQDRMLLSTDGPFKIRQELRNNNIDENIIESLFEKIDYDELRGKLNKIILKRIKGNHNKSNYILKQKIIGDMINLGYDKDMIVELINDNLGDDHSVINNEYKKVLEKLNLKYEGEELERQIRQKLRQKGFSLEDINSIEKSDY